LHIGANQAPVLAVLKALKKQFGIGYRYRVRPDWTIDGTFTGTLSSILATLLRDKELRFPDRAQSFHDRFLRVSVSCLFPSGEAGRGRGYDDQPEGRVMSASASKLMFRVPAIAAVVLGANSTHAQDDIHNGPVAVRPMITAPLLMGKTPQIRKIAHCVAERAKLRETLQAALNDKENGRDTPDQIRARWREADKALAASTKVMDPAHRPIYCDEAAQWAEEYVLGD
jgi:hypothetical protein